MTMRFKARLLGATFGMATIVGAAGAFAQEGNPPDSGIPGEFSANVALTTDYIFRGISQSDKGPAIQGGFDWTYSMFYVGAWASSIDYDFGSGIEIDYYAGVAPEFNGITWDSGIIYYSYPDSPDYFGLDQDFFELYTGLSGALGPLSLGASVAYSPDYYLESGDSVYAKITAGIPLGPVSLDGHVGWLEMDSDAFQDVMDWSVGLTTTFEGFGLDLRYGDTDEVVDTDTLWFTVSRSIN